MNKGWVIIAFVVAALYWLQGVLIPLALAVLLTFLLSPVVGALPKVIAPRLGTLKTAQGHDVKIDWSLLTVGSVLFDAVFVPGGEKSVKALTAEPRAVEFVGGYKHCKTIGATGDGRSLLQSAGIGTKDREPAGKGRPNGSKGVVLGKDADVSGVAGKFIQAVAQHRHWERERQE